MSKNPRVDFHRAIFSNLTVFIKVIDNLEKHPDVMKTFETAPTILTNGRTLKEMVLDDTMDAFAVIMRDIPNDQIPVSFFKQLMTERHNRIVSMPESITALAERMHAARLPGAEVKPPEFIMTLNENVPPDILQTLITNWMNTVGNLGRTLMSDDAISASKAAASIVEKTGSIYEDMFEKILTRTLAMGRMGQKALPAPAKSTGDDEDADESEEIVRLSKKIKAAGMPPEALKRARKELRRLKNMNPQSSEGAVLTNYLDILTSLPWKKSSDTSQDLHKTEEILNADHYGMQKVKDAIAEHVAVQNRLGKPSGQILLLVGPPGVGKTSIAKSVAKATGREYVRMSLGGVDDEAKIRGHKMTYIGAMPGDVIKAMIKARTTNPLIVLDEIDKLGRSMKGDPTAALLETLDPEQNHAFKDHYVDLEYDLSNVMFFCTANDFGAIPEPLRDRMEVIHLPGYLHDEKFQIAKRYLTPKQIGLKGMTMDDIRITDDALHRIINEYTQEAGVRQLERTIGRVCRKAVVEFAKGRRTPVTVTAENLDTYAGVTRVKHDRIHDEDRVGIVNGLAYTSIGGCRLPIQAATLPANGFRLSATGKLGDVMKESVIVAEGLVRSRAATFGISQDRLNSTELRLHAPEGAVPKDGPSAGLAMTTVIISALTGIKIRHDVAMTGEVDLDGNALKIGGLPEKLEGALRAGVKTVLIPKDNEGDLADVPEAIKSQLTIHTVSKVDDVLKYALASPIPPVLAVHKEREPGAPTQDEIRRVFNWMSKQAGNDNLGPDHPDQKVAGHSCCKPKGP